MKKIKLKDYKKDCVCYIDEFEDIQIINADEVEEIQKLSKKYRIYGTTSEEVFEDSFVEFNLKELFKDYANCNGYEDMNDYIDYESDEYKKVEQAVGNFIKSLGDTNNIYFRDRNVIIEVE